MHHTMFAAASFKAAMQVHEGMLTSTPIHSMPDHATPYHTMPRHVTNINPSKQASRQAGKDLFSSFFYEILIWDIFILLNEPVQTSLGCLLRSNFSVHEQCARSCSTSSYIITLLECSN